MSTIGIGLIGAGKAGRNFAAALGGSAAARIVSVCTRRSSTAEQAARELGIPHWTDDVRALLARPEVDAVIVASPDDAHGEQAVAAAEAKKHVLCEKPMCRSVDQADRMIEAARGNGVILMVGFTERFNHPYAEAARRIASGEIGTPRMILARRCHPRATVRGRDWLNDARTGGVLSYAGTRNIDLICWLMGSTPQRVYAEMGQLVLAGQDFTDCAIVTFRFVNGSIAVLYETFAYPDGYPHGVDRSIEVLGERGMLRVDLMSQPLEVYSGGGHQLVDSLTWPRSERGTEGALRAEAEHFVACVQSGYAPAVGGEEGRLAIRIADAARRAFETARAVGI